MRIGWLIVLAMLAACYSPDLSGIRYRCSNINPACPDGQMCNNGFCVNPGEMVDASSPNGGPPQLSTVLGCKNPGYDLGQNGMGMNAYACPGKFNSIMSRQGLEAQLCANGSTLCGILSQSQIDRCNLLPNFFASQVTWPFNNRYHYQPPQTAAQVDCSNLVAMGQEVFLGCGGLTASQAMNNGIYRITKQCGPVNNVNDLDCATAQQRQWNCNGSGSDLWDTTNNNPQDGILCCK